MKLFVVLQPPAPILSVVAVLLGVSIQGILRLRVRPVRLVEACCKVSGPWGDLAWTPIAES